MPTLGERLVQLKNERNLLQKDIAKGVDISLRAYRYYENDERQPGVDILIKLADFFNVSLDYLTGRKNYDVNEEGQITVKVPPDIFNLDTKK